MCQLSFHIPKSSSSLPPHIFTVSSTLFDPSGELSREILPDCVVHFPFIGSPHPPVFRLFDIHVSWFHKWTSLIQGNSGQVLPSMHCTAQSHLENTQEARVLFSCVWISSPGSAVFSKQPSRIYWDTMNWPQITVISYYLTSCQRVCSGGLVASGFKDTQHGFKGFWMLWF